MRAFELVIVLIGGFILDFFLGDPSWIPHPVVLIGRLISGLEKLIRKRFPETDEGERLGGSVLTLLVVSVSTLVPLVVILLVGKISIYLRMVLEIIWVWQILSARTLYKEGIMVYEKVVSGDLGAARNQVARIVGRDTGSLSMEEVIKACIETIAESTSDGIVAPLFYLTLGGVPLGFMYKSGNTLDSMVGYKNQRYIYFGRTSARLDDVLNFIPARITALIMILSAWILNRLPIGHQSSVNGAGLAISEKTDSFKYDINGAFRIWKRDRLKHLSPNSGNPEATCAGALGLQLGGDAYYFGKRYEKATLGDNSRRVEAEDIKRAGLLMYCTSVVSLVICCLILLALSFLL